MRVYGTGNLWLRKSKRHPKGEYWLRYRDSTGRQRTENTHFCECCDKRAEAKATGLLAQRIGEVKIGMLPSPKASRALVEDLAQSPLKAKSIGMLLSSHPAHVHQT
jgi:hypothetical protein